MLRKEHQATLADSKHGRNTGDVLTSCIVQSTAAAETLINGRGAQRTDTQTAQHRVH